MKAQVLNNVKTNKQTINQRKEQKRKHIAQT